MATEALLCCGYLMPVQILPRQPDGAPVHLVAELRESEILRLVAQNDDGRLLVSASADPDAQAGSRIQQGRDVVGNIRSQQGFLTSHGGLAPCGFAMSSAALARFSPYLLYTDLYGEGQGSR
ncbi:hypothetical protein AR457_39680 [Streptomyces agglomeratus]|nr:hypothetical protein AR457_39680 [Streptomyces agglomeratus]